MVTIFIEAAYVVQMYMYSKHTIILYSTCKTDNLVNDSIAFFLLIGSAEFSWAHSTDNMMISYCTGTEENPKVINNMNVF